MFNVADCFRRVFLVYVLLVMLLPARQVAAQANAPAVPLPVLRMPNLAVGTRCFGFLPCTQIDRFVRPVLLKRANLGRRPRQGKEERCSWIT